MSLQFGVTGKVSPESKRRCNYNDKEILAKLHVRWIDLEIQFAFQLKVTLPLCSLAGVFFPVTRFQMPHLNLKLTTKGQETPTTTTTRFLNLSDNISDFSFPPSSGLCKPIKVWAWLSQSISRRRTRVMAGNLLPTCTRAHACPEAQSTITVIGGGLVFWVKISKNTQRENPTSFHGNLFIQFLGTKGISGPRVQIRIQWWGRLMALPWDTNQLTRARTFALIHWAKQVNCLWSEQKRRERGRERGH